MKWYRLSFTAAVVMLTLEQMSLAQPEYSDTATPIVKRNAVIVYPVSFVFNAVSVDYERVIGAENSLAVTVNWSAFGSAKVTDTRFEMFAIGITYRMYPWSVAPEQGWVGVGTAFLVMDMWEEDGRSYAEDISSVVFSAELGYRLRLVGDFSLTPWLQYQVPFHDDVLGQMEKRGPIDTHPTGGLWINIGVSWLW